MRRFIPGPAGGSAVEGEGIRIPRGETAPTLETAPPLTLDDKPSWKQALSAMDTEKFDLSLPAISSMQPFKTLARLLVYVESLRKGGSSSGGAHLLVRDPTGATGAMCCRSVLNEEPRLGTGATLLLQNTSIYAPPGGPPCLVITPENILQVFYAPPPGLFPATFEGNPGPRLVQDHPPARRVVTERPAIPLLVVPDPRNPGRPAARMTAPVFHPSVSQGSGIENRRILGDLLVADDGVIQVSYGGLNSNSPKDQFKFVQGPRPRTGEENGGGLGPTDGMVGRHSPSDEGGGAVPRHIPPEGRGGEGGGGGGIIGQQPQRQQRGFGMKQNQNSSRMKRLLLQEEVNLEEELGLGLGEFEGFEVQPVRGLGIEPNKRRRDDVEVPRAGEQGSDLNLVLSKGLSDKPYESAQCQGATGRGVQAQGQVARGQDQGAQDSQNESQGGVFDGRDLFEGLPGACVVPPPAFHRGPAMKPPMALPPLQSRINLRQPRPDIEEDIQLDDR